ncbi:hypothetical protein ETH_00002395 [Eimeria tenella]|uniref:Uncharacterized protein n=1 Tax=Eimeria tenella TaxID=5802 RepID=U6L0L0_EIMTE|nr:hypothetical protein ETH_00002395 [Eimeria tenella]CDJ42733.1 hypothetical protein ETH_00002395 [Eimeria tenella]|eukprot:XP_013233483.1 hypothetical protein ETH_00002395 [Eimeria tenella]
MRRSPGRGAAGLAHWTSGPRVGAPGQRGGAATGTADAAAAVAAVKVNSVQSAVRKKNSTCTDSCCHSTWAKKLFSAPPNPSGGCRQCWCCFWRLCMFYSEVPAGLLLGHRVLLSVQVRRFKNFQVSAEPLMKFYEEYKSLLVFQIACTSLKEAARAEALFQHPLERGCRQKLQAQPMGLPAGHWALKRGHPLFSVFLGHAA